MTLLHDGVGLTVIALWLGHESAVTTARYAHLSRDSIQSAASRITGSIGVDLFDDGNDRPDEDTDERQRTMTR